MALPVAIDVQRDFGPHPKQRRFIDARNRFCLALTGVGFGKTWALTLKCLLVAVNNPGVLTLLAGRSFRDLDDVLVPLLMSHVERVKDLHGVNLITRIDKMDNRIHLLGGGIILLRSYQLIDKIRSLNLGAAFIDEVEWSSASPKDVFGVMNERVRVACPWHTVCYATSPNGLLGVTRIFHEAQVRGDTDYHITHGTTLDNPYLSEAFVRTLRNSMSERRWLQEVEGRVLRPLHVVFSEFTDERHMVDWYWRDHPRVPWVLGVDWGTNHHHVGIMVQVMENGAWVVADELLCDDMSRAQFQRELRQWVETRAAVCGYPAAAGTDRAVPVLNQWLMNTFGHHGTMVRNCKTHQQQYIVNGIELMRDRLAPAEGPPMLLVSNRLIKPESQSTAGIVQAFRTYRYQKDREGNPTSKPYKDDVHDHVCFPAGTLVRLAGGADAPIETVGVGDMVETGSGPRRVAMAARLPARRLWELRTSAGRVLHATPEHPVWTTRAGMVPLDSMRYGDILWACENKPEHSTAGVTAGIPSQATSATLRTSSGRDRTCTVTSGWLPTGRSLPAGTFTTSTVTPATTSLRTLNASPPSSITPTTRGQMPAERPPPKCSQTAKAPCTHGAAPQTAPSGTSSTGTMYGMPAQSGRLSASSAELNSTGVASGTPASAAPTANHSTDGSLVWTTRIGLAISAARRSQSTSTPRTEPALDVVVSSAPAGRSAEVFSLSVEGTHEFFANGILVSNCDALRYLYVTTRQDPALHGGDTLSMHGLGDDGRYVKGGLRKLPGQFR